MLRAVTVQDTQLALLHAVLGEVWGRLYRPRVQSSPGQAAAGRALATGDLSEKEGLLWQLRALAMCSRMPAYQWWSAHVCKKEAGELRTVPLKVLSAHAATDIMPVTYHGKHGALSVKIAEKAIDGDFRCCLWLEALVGVKGTGLHMSSSPTASATN
jgi:hypothetical protein